jgi:membrane-associated phospholipid phosphatase
MARLALYWSLGLSLATLVCIAVVDAPVAHWVAAHETHPAIWMGVLHVLEYVIGVEPWEWIGVVVLVTGTLAALLYRRGAVPWIAVTLSHLLVNNLTMWLKLFFGRLRPHQWHGGPTWFHHGSSFPSGHVTLFASLVLPLVALYPRLRWLVVIPIYAGVTRVMVSAHFVSDVVGGFALCCAIAALAVTIATRVQPRGGAR